MDNLREFYFSKARDEVKIAILSHIDANALKSMYLGEEVKGFKQAKDALDSFFKEMEIEFDEKEKPTTNNPKR